jgi:signal transduction histidine kinase
VSVNNTFAPFTIETIGDLRAIVAAGDDPHGIAAAPAFSVLETDAGMRAAVADAGARAFLVLPLEARGRSFGAALFLRCGRDRTYEPVELVVARELARRIALSLDHARLYAEAREAARVREGLMAVVSHDLRSPIAATHLAAEIILAESPGDRARRACESIRRCARQMTALLDDLLDVHRLGAAPMKLALRPEDAAALLDAAVEILEPLAAKRGLTLELEPSDPAVRVQCDLRRVLQVLTNIAGNAIKFTPAGGKVTLGYTRAGARVRFFVNDTGPGILAEHRSRIFEPFWRGDEKSPGFGLGLAIARGIVEAHGGRIDVESRVGGGCTFSFDLAPPIFDRARTM